MGPHFADICLRNDMAPPIVHSMASAFLGLFLGHAFRAVFHIQGIGDGLAVSKL